MNIKIKPDTPKIIIGLGNPGARFVNTRHNIGFKILDALASEYNSTWIEKHNYLYTKININNNYILLIKPQTYMNDSGKVLNYILKQDYKPEDILVVHDELEFVFGKLGYKLGGSARGHNGIKSLINFAKGDFWRLRVGIDRPVDKSQVPDYVLSSFTESKDEINNLINAAVESISRLY